MATYVNKDAHGHHYVCIIQVSFTDHSQISYKSYSGINQIYSRRVVSRILGSYITYTIIDLHSLHCTEM